MWKELGDGKQNHPYLARICFHDRPASAVPGLSSAAQPVTTVEPIAESSCLKTPSNQARFAGSARAPPVDDRSFSRAALPPTTKPHTGRISLSVATSRTRQKRRLFPVASSGGAGGGCVRREARFGQTACHVRRRRRSGGGSS
jgi:hypothetical protein